MILVALGSNLGDRAANLASALDMLSQHGIHVLRASSLVETPALLPEGAPKDWNLAYLNQVVEIRTALAPRALLRALKQCEAALGRKKAEHWSPREIDLDLLAYGTEVIDTPELTLPHPRLQERMFVLEPLCEIAPGWMHPCLKRSAAALLAQLKGRHKQPQLMGILNLTPDSFSGDGVAGIRSVHARIMQLVNEGADIIDIGAESTRPKATPLSVAEELARLAPVFDHLLGIQQETRIRFSLDTRHVQTAEHGLSAGITIINDVGGLRDAAMLSLLASVSCDSVVMHSLSVPADPAVVLADTEDPIETIVRWKEAVTARAVHAGISVERLIFDPGIGFGKTPAQSLALIRGAARLTQSGGRWLFGHSRKSFLRHAFTEQYQEDNATRDRLTLALSSELAAAGVNILRVHNVALHKEAFAHA